LTLRAKNQLRLSYIEEFQRVQYEQFESNWADYEQRLKKYLGSY